MNKLAPKAVVFLLSGQFLGLLFLCLSTVVESPLAIFICFSAGIGLLLITICFWLFIVLTEVREIKEDLEDLFHKKSQS